MFTGYQYFVYFHTKTSHIEKVQKRATKFIIGLSLKKYSYKDRLIQLNLPTLKYKRLRWDMTEVFKIKQKYEIERCKMLLILCCIFCYYAL